MSRLRAAWALTSLCSRSMFSGKRLLLTSFLLFLPPFVSILVGMTAHAGIDPNWGLHAVALRLVISLYILLLALVHALALSSGELEEGTAVYLFLGILPRWAVLLVRYAVTWILLSALTGGALALSAIAIHVVAQGSLGTLLLLAVRYTLVAAVGLGCYLAFFLFCGYAFARPTAVGLVSTILWEMVVTFLLPMRFAAYTLTNNLYGLALALALGGEQGRWFRHRRGAYEIPSYDEASIFVSLVLGFFLVAAMVAVMNRSVLGKEAR